MMTLTHYATGTACDFRLGLHHNGRMVEGGFVMSVVNFLIFPLSAAFGGKFWDIGKGKINFNLCLFDWATIIVKYAV